MRTTAASRKALGTYGENVAARLLTEQLGMRLLDRNWRCPEGELDLVLRDRDVLVACEVKTRRGEGCGSPVEAVDAVRLERLYRLAWRWAEAHELRPQDVRVDVVGVWVQQKGRPRVDHVAGMGMG